MSATQLAAFVIAAVLATGMASAGAALQVKASRQSIRDGDLVTSTGLGSLGLFAGAFVTIIVGVVMAWPASDEAPPAPRCQAGTYDNGGVSSNGPVCLPWPDGGAR